jgi:hypothetical protein
VDHEFRDDGTVICPTHGLRYDPETSTGCIRCPRPSQQPGKKSMSPARSKAPSAAPRASNRASSPGSVAPPRLIPSEPPPSGGAGFRPAQIGHYSTPPLPFDPGIGLAPGVSDPRLKIIEAPKRRASRRGILLALGAVMVGGAGGTAWYFRPQGPTNWAKKVKPLAWTSADGPRTGAIYVPTSAEQGPRPVLLAIDVGARPGDTVARLARHAERHGWIVASTSAIGRYGPNNADAGEADSLLEHVRQTQNADATPVMLTGFDHAGECAYRLAAMHSDVYGGAVVESCGIGSWRDVGGLAKPGTPFYLFARAGDKTRDSMLTMKDEMERRGMRVTWEELPGPHEPMSGEELENSFLWLDSLHG